MFGEVAVESSWNPVQHWNNDEGLDTWLKEQGLENSQTIINKLAEGEQLTFAKGTRRLRYEAGTFYLEAFVELHVGQGKHLDTHALQARWQPLVPNTKVTVKLDRRPEAPRLHVTERDVANKYSYLIELNPVKLRSPQQVAKVVAEVDKILTR